MAKKVVQEQLTIEEVSDLPELKRAIYCHGHKGSVKGFGDDCLIQVNITAHSRALLEVIKERLGISFGKTISNLLLEQHDEIIRDIEVYGGDPGKGFGKAVEEKLGEILGLSKGKKKAC